MKKQKFLVLLIVLFSLFLYNLFLGTLIFVSLDGNSAPNPTNDNNTACNPNINIIYNMPNTTKCQLYLKSISVFSFN